MGRMPDCRKVGLEKEWGALAAAFIVEMGKKREERKFIFRKFRRSKPLRILSLIQPYLPHFAHVAEEKNLYSSYAYRTHNLSIKTVWYF